MDKRWRCYELEQATASLQISPLKEFQDSLGKVFISSEQLRQEYQESAPHKGEADMDVIVEIVEDPYSTNKTDCRSDKGNDPPP